MIEKIKTQEATLALLRMGQNAEEKLQSALVGGKEASASELSDELGWTLGKVHSTIDRLDKKGLVQKKIIVENNRTKKIISLVSHEGLLA